MGPTQRNPGQPDSNSSKSLETNTTKEYSNLPMKPVLFLLLKLLFYLQQNDIIGASFDEFNIELNQFNLIKTSE